MHYFRRVEADREEVEQATGRKSPPIKAIVFLSLLDKDPSEEFLGKIREYLRLRFPRVLVKKASACTRDPNGLVVDVATGLKGAQLSAKSVSMSGDQAEVSVYWYTAPLGAGSFTYYMARRGREWIVVEVVRRSIS